MSSCCAGFVMTWHNIFLHCHTQVSVSAAFCINNTFYYSSLFGFVFVFLQKSRKSITWKPWYSYLSMFEFEIFDDKSEKNGETTIVCSFKYIIFISRIDQDSFSLHFVWLTEVYSEYKKKVINPQNLLFLPIDDLFFWRVIEFLTFICSSMCLLFIILGFILLGAHHQGNDDNYQG